MTEPAKRMHRSMKCNWSTTVHRLVSLDHCLRQHSYHSKLNSLCGSVCTVKLDHGAAMDPISLPLQIHCHVAQAWNWPVAQSTRFDIVAVHGVCDSLASHKPDRWHDGQDWSTLLSPILSQSPIVPAICQSMFVPFSNHQPSTMLHINSIFDWTHNCPANRQVNKCYTMNRIVALIWW